MLSYLFWTAVSFFSGSVMYSYLIPKLLFKKDITKISKDGNPGCGNVFTCVGIPCGIFCLLLELAKGAVPIWLALKYVSPDNLMFAGVLAGPVLGHAFSPMLKNHGGKAIAVTFSTYIGLCPHSVILFMLAVPFVFFSTVLRITPHSLRVMISYATMLGSSLFFPSFRTGSGRKRAFPFREGVMIDRKAVFIWRIQQHSAEKRDLSEPVIWQRP